MPRVTVAEEAAGSLTEAVDYISEVLGESKAALALVDAFEAACDAIGRHPLLCPVSQEPRLASLGYRKVLVQGYVAPYRVDGDEVYVMNFFHQSQDYARLV